jgi:hypothetical protein
MPSLFIGAMDPRLRGDGFAVFTDVNVSRPLSNLLVAGVFTPWGNQAPQFLE